MSLNQHIFEPNHIDPRTMSNIYQSSPKSLLEILLTEIATSNTLLLYLQSARYKMQQNSCNTRILNKLLSK